MLSGIDISKWQSTTPSLTGLSFLFAKASQGTAKDSTYDLHVADARKAGLVVGAYCFNQATVNHYNADGFIVEPGVPIADQVTAFAAAAGDVDLYALDVEGSYAFTLAETADFLNRFRALTGRKIGLYHSLSGYPNAGQDWNWVAKWSTVPPSIPWTFWQYQGSPLDSDKFNGDLAALNALAGKEPDVDPKVDIPAAVCDVASGGTVYKSASGSDYYILSWAGAKGVGVYATGGKVVPIRLNLGSSTAPNLVIGWIGSDKISNVRAAGVDATPFTQADIDAAVTAQKTADAAALAAANAALKVANTKISAAKTALS